VKEEVEMRITPLDVRKQEFRRVMRGLDADEVLAFLTTVADEYETVLNDNKALRERLLELDDKVQEYRSIERTLRDTLLTAERVTVESKDNARREATLIVKEAQLTAEKALRDITSEAVRLRQEVQRLRSQRDAYLAKMKVVAESHVKFIESAERDFVAEDRSGLDGPESVPERSMRDAPAPMVAPRPANLFDGSAVSNAAAEAIPGLGEILDRLSQGQRDALENAQKIELPPVAPAAPSARPEPSPPDAPSKWNMDQFRRDLQNIATGRPLDPEDR
jgi:cell division initiation protein